MFPTHIPKDDVAEGLLGALLVKPDDKAAASALADRLRELGCDLDGLADHLTEEGAARQLVFKTFQVAYAKCVPVNLCLMAAVFLAEAFDLGGTPREATRLGPQPRPADDPSMDDLRDALERIRRGQRRPWIKRPGIPAPYFGVPEVDNTYRPGDVTHWVHNPSPDQPYRKDHPSTSISVTNTAGG